METKEPNNNCPFCAVLHGREPGEIIAWDKEKRFALIQSLHPVGSIHWLAVPAEHFDSTEELERSSREHFLDLMEFALTEVKAQAAEFPELQSGFTIKFHFGAYETIPHAKLHILSVE